MALVQIHFSLSVACLFMSFGTFSCLGFFLFLFLDLILVCVLCKNSTITWCLISTFRSISVCNFWALVHNQAKIQDVSFISSVHEFLTELFIKTNLFCGPASLSKYLTVCWCSVFHYVFFIFNPSWDLSLSDKKFFGNFLLTSSVFIFINCWCFKASCVLMSLFIL